MMTSTQEPNTSLLGEQGWHSGESARLPPMWPGFDSRTRCHMWVEFVGGSRLCSERFFSGYCGFPLSSKTNISKFQFDPGMHGHILNEFLRTPRCSVGKQITITNYKQNYLHNSILSETTDLQTAHSKAYGEENLEY